MRPTRVQGLEDLLSVLVRGEIDHDQLQQLAYGALDRDGTLRHILRPIEHEPRAGVLAAEIVEELEAALAQFAELAASLPIELENEG